LFFIFNPFPSLFSYEWILGFLFSHADPILSDATVVHVLQSPCEKREAWRRKNLFVSEMLHRLNVIVNELRNLGQKVDDEDLW